MRTFWLKVPLTPSPVTLYVAPCSGASKSSSPILKQAVVTYNSSRFGPPNATEVT